MTRCSLVTLRVLRWELCHIAGLFFRAGLLLRFLPVRRLVPSVPYMGHWAACRKEHCGAGATTPCIGDKQAVNVAGSPAYQLAFRCLCADVLSIRQRESLCLQVPIPADMQKMVQAKRAELVERVAEVDEEVGELFLMEEPVDSETLRAGIRRATLALKFVPVFMGRWACN